MSEERDWQVFTLEEANAALALVRPILIGLQEDHLALEHARRAFGAYAASLKRYRLRVESHYIERDIGEIVDRIQEGIAAVATLGIELKNIEMGLIDFPALRNGEVVFLCYHLDEPEISTWHHLESGFAGRQPLDEAFDR
jgi:hypothetical protein